MITSSLLATFLIALFSGGLTYEAASRIFFELDWLGVKLSKRQKRLLVYPVCLLVTLLPLALAGVLGVVVVTADVVFTAFAAAYGASQIFHARELPGQPEDDEPADGS